MYKRQPIALSCTPYLQTLSRVHGRFYVFLAFIIPWMCDIGAYFVGTFLGKHKMCPKISPKKTVEGLVGGIVTVSYTHLADPDEACMAARLMNALFGGTPHSMLFRSVREKLSLCYYCASSYDYIKGVMLVDSGVEAAKADEAQAEILRQLDLLRQGAFTDEDLEAARRSVLNQFQEVADLQSSRMGWYLRQSVSTRFTSPEESAAALAAVTRDEVCAAARQVHPICVYLLQSEKGGED